MPDNFEQVPECLKRFVDAARGIPAKESPTIEAPQATPESVTRHCDGTACTL